MMYADNLIVADSEEAGLQTRFTDWQGALESKGLKININKTEAMVCSKTHEKRMVKDIAENVVKQTETFKYLGSAINAKRGCEQDVRSRIKTAGQKWRAV